MTGNNVKWEFSCSDNELGIVQLFNQRLKMTLPFSHQIDQRHGLNFSLVKGDEFVPCSP